MPAWVSQLIFLMALGTAVLDAVLVIKLFALFNKKTRVHIKRMNDQYGLLAILVLSTLAVLGTLFIEYAANLQPCLFCWYQRIFMYPIPLLSLIAIIKGEKLSDIADYIIGLSVFGFAIALYQHLLQMLPQGSLIPCSASDECAIRPIFEFGFVTIPWMAVTMFAVIFLIAFLARRRNA